MTNLPAPTTNTQENAHVRTLSEPVWVGIMRGYTRWFVTVEGGARTASAYYISVSRRKGRDVVTVDHRPSLGQFTSLAEALEALTIDENRTAA